MSWLSLSLSLSLGGRRPLTVQSRMDEYVHFAGLSVECVLLSDARMTGGKWFCALQSEPRARRHWESPARQ